MPQLVVISLAAAMLILYYFKLILLFKVLASVLISIFSYSALFQVIMFLIYWIDPNRGKVEINGEMMGLGMDLTGVFVGAFCFVIASIIGVIHFRSLKNSSLVPEKQLNVASLIICSIVFIATELF
ncbi:hypothetical protein CW751_03560 [Brumimicrobium salinarum]|uniref:Uncharacterized protein n=1 Tax=Brumimicrobium salinarum TaxID=2058658 RepID=A0A2I0R4V6_9FLAO|nr:hypothetical protein [Brumimicrobium salinarum]PKR81613.1 hypothetical protein CW751_03560 [Brumimicrobium salinarum]